MFTVCLTIFLYGIVSEMGEIVGRFNIEGRTGCSDVAFLEEKYLSILSNHGVDSDIKFSAVDKHRLLNILLH